MRKNIKYPGEQYTKALLNSYAYENMYLLCDV